jgi:protoporphyrinogen oxidase
MEAGGSIGNLLITKAKAALPGCRMQGSERYICSRMSSPTRKIAIIGAGPAGLTAAYLLGKHGGFQVEVFEQHPTLVGGISRTESYKGFLFDIGGHRFFSKSKEVEDFWTEILSDEMLERPRSSRIYYNNQFFSYPLVAGQALRQLGLLESARCVASYCLAKLRPVKNPRSFEDWVINHFGKRLYQIFFKTYTEKVWGIPCSEISADWAAQRIKGLSLSAAISNALFPAGRHKKGEDKLIKTLIDSFRYPKYGPGQMWETCRRKAEAMGVQVHMGQGVQTVNQDPHTKQWQLTLAEGHLHTGYDHVISSAPLRELVLGMPGLFSSHALAAANALQYRDFITVVLMLKDRNQFSDNWIYIHDPGVKVGRIQNFKSWSPYMVPDEKLVCYGLEYFCFAGDGMWNSGDADLTKLAVSELVSIGLCAADDVLDSYVVRQPKAYPVYDHTYQQHIEVIRKEMDPLKGLVLVGRNGMHKYNNQDHSMMTAMLAVKNIIAGEPLYDLWQVNQDAEYHEAGDRGSAASGGRMVPGKLSA